LLNAATAAASLAQSEYLPHLTATAGFGYRDDNFVNNSRDELKQKYYATQLNLNQRVFSLKTIRDIKAAAKEEAIENTNAIRVQQQLELAVTRAYLNYLKAREILALHKRIKELVERNLEISGTRFLNGISLFRQLPMPKII
jgi:outer membrane protein TolC